MSREQLHQKISDLLETLSINNNRLSLHEERLSQLDIDVLRKQCIDLYEQINRLVLEGKKSSTKPKSETQKEVVIPEAETIKEEPVVEAKPVEEPKKEAPIQEEVKQEEPKQEEKKQKQQVVKEDKAPVAETASSSEADSPQSIHSKLQDEAEMVSLFEKFNSKPIDKITKAISISKRFEFQNNFFEGDAKEYKTFMEKIEGAGDREEAFQVYHAYKNKLKWEHEDLKDELKSLLYRKYLT